jgi:hypothetical protein
MFRCTPTSHRVFSLHQALTCRISSKYYNIIRTSSHEKSTRRRLAADISALGQHATDIQKTKIFNQSNALQRRLDPWAQIQVLYMPAVAPIRAMEDACRSEGTAALKPESFQLRLPSQLAPHLPCNQQLRECEWELRYAQAHDALNDVRQHIRLFTHLNTFRMANVRGQCASTRARTALDLAVEKKRASKAKYDAARDALTALAPLLGKFGWTDIMRPLGWTDMRPMGDFIQGQSEGTRDIPWIWKTPGVLQDNNEGLQDCTYHDIFEGTVKLTDGWQVFALSGARQERERRVGPKNCCCCLKRCRGY